MIAVASLPDNTGHLHLCSTKQDLDNLPTFDRDRQATPPSIHYESPAASLAATPLPAPLSHTQKARQEQMEAARMCGELDDDASESEKDPSRRRRLKEATTRATRSIRGIFR
jgi:hypothetical protein